MNAERIEQAARSMGVVEAEAKAAIDEMTEPLRKEMALTAISLIIESMQANIARLRAAAKEL